MSAHLDAALPTHPLLVLPDRRPTTASPKGPERTNADLIRRARTVQEALGELIEDLESSRHEIKSPLRAVSPSSRPGLTAREVEVLCLVGAGLANRGIASRLGIAEKTVKAHISSIFGKLQTRSRSQAVLAAARLGVLSDVA